MDHGRVIIVEGKNDRNHIRKMLKEEIEILCTYGTFGIEKFDEMLEEHDLDNREVFIFVDADEPGEQLRKQLRIELPNAVHIMLSDDWTEVEETPEPVVARQLLAAGIKIDPLYLI